VRKARIRYYNIAGIGRDDNRKIKVKNNLKLKIRINDITIWLRRDISIKIPTILIILNDKEFSMGKNNGTLLAQPTVKVNLLRSVSSINQLNM
jgi:hypothetical protein